MRCVLSFFSCTLDIKFGPFQWFEVNSNWSEMLVVAVFCYFKDASFIYLNKKRINSHYMCSISMPFWMQLGKSVLILLFTVWVCCLEPQQPLGNLGPAGQSPYSVFDIWCLWFYKALWLSLSGWIMYYIFLSLNSINPPVANLYW